MVLLPHQRLFVRAMDPTLEEFGRVCEEARRAPPPGAVDEAAEWVSAVTGATPPEKEPGEATRMAAFQAWLKSGELLCELVSALPCRASPWCCRPRSC